MGWLVWIPLGFVCFLIFAVVWVAYVSVRYGSVDEYLADHVPPLASRFLSRFALRERPEAPDPATDLSVPDGMSPVALADMVLRIDSRPIADGGIDLTGEIPDPVFGDLSPEDADSFRAAGRVTLGFYDGLVDPCSSWFRPEGGKRFYLGPVFEALGIDAGDLVPVFGHASRRVPFHVGIREWSRLGKIRCISPQAGPEGFDRAAFERLMVILIEAGVPLDGGLELQGMPNLAARRTTSEWRMILGSPRTSEVIEEMASSTGGA